MQSIAMKYLQNQPIDLLFRSTQQHEYVLCLS
ncbi:hypothetical protein [Vibrio phage 29Fa.3]|nr:hypothetical protein [Vibrio phage 29Fa.3]